MADKKITELVQANTSETTDLLIVVKDPAGSAVTRKMTVNTFFSNVSTINTSNTTVSNNLIIPLKTTPANSISTTILRGSMFHDSNYLYIATSNNTVKRVSLSTF